MKKTTPCTVYCVSFIERKRVVDQRCGQPKSLEGLGDSKYKKDYYTTVVQCNEISFCRRVEKDLRGVSKEDSGNRKFQI